MVAGQEAGGGGHSQQSSSLAPQPSLPTVPSGLAITLCRSCGPQASQKSAGRATA